MLALLLAACTVPTSAPPQKPIDVDAKTTIFVTSNGWHSGIVLAKADIPPQWLPETGDFPEAHFLEIGWGDAVYYPAEQPTFGMSLQAALVPSPAVVHVVGLWGEPARVFPNAEVVALPIDDDNLHRLIGYIDASFERSGATRADAAGPGLYASSRFYPAKGKFHAFNTCNTWTARALEAAGFDIRATETFGADTLMQQVRASAGLQ